MTVFGNQKQPRSGIALLLVMACIVLITVVVVSICRQSLMLAMESRDSADQLQKRWGQVSLERAGLITAVNMYGADPPPIGPLVETEDPRQTPPEYPAWDSQYELSVTLSGQVYRLVFADESAKASLATLLQYNDPDAVGPVITSLTNGTMRRLQLPKRRTLESRPKGLQQPAPAIQSWGEVLSINTEDPRATRITDLPAMTQHITIWGDGKVNLLRGSDRVLYEVSRSVISGGKSRDWIEEYRESFPKKTLSMVLRELRLEVREQKALSELFSVRSTCVSVWVLGEHWAADHSLCVANRSDSGVLWDIQTTRYAP